MDQFLATKGGIYDSSTRTIKASATARDLIDTLLYDPTSREDDIISKAIGCVVDDLEMATRVLECDDPDCETLQRVLMRCIYRIHIGQALVQRYAAAEAASESEEPQRTAEGFPIPEGSLPYLVPTGDDGQPDFTRARLARTSDLADMGWMHRFDVRRCISTILGSPPTTQDQALRTREYEDTKAAEEAAKDSEEQEDDESPEAAE